MSVASDHGVWQLAVDRGLITSAQLEQALADQRELRAAGQEVGIDQLLLKHGWLDARTVADLVRADAQRTAGVPAMRRYEVHERIGEGAGSVIYRAIDRELGRPVALKVLREDAHADAMRKRFTREAQSVARLSHANVVRVYDVGVEDGRMYIVMELVEGKPLDKLMERRGLKLGELLAILEKVARGVQHAHDNGIVHRDLKPANILVTSAGEPKVVDFGLAHVVGEGGALTRTGVAVGTPLYMAPEQVRGVAGTITARTDVYALGAILYEMLTGHTPHDGATVAEIYHRICHVDPTPPSRRRVGVAPALDAIALKALEAAAEHRYASAAEFADDVARFRRGEPVQATAAGGWSRTLRRAARRASPVWVGALAVVLGVAVWVLLRPGAPTRSPPRPPPAPAPDRTVDAMQLLDGARPLLDAAHRATYFADSDDAAIRSQVEQALQRIDRAVAMAPKLASAHHERGRALEMSGRLRDAEAAWRLAMELDATMASSRYQLGRVLTVRAYLQTSRPTIDEDEGKRLADEARQLLDSPGALGDPLQKRLADAMAAYARADPRALEIVAEGLDKFRNAPGVEELHWLAGLCARWDRRTPHYDAALALRPKYPLALYGRAMTLPHEPAMRDLDAAIRLWPAFADAFLYRGYQHGMVKAWDAQAADYATAERLDPSDLHVHLYRGIRLYDMGDFRGSVAEYTRILDKSPRAAMIWSNRGNSKSRLDDLDGAIADHTESVRLAPSHNSYLNRATVHLRKRDRGAAMRDLNAALRLWPDYGDALYLRGIMQWEDGRREEGYADLQRSVGRVILYPDAARVAEEMRKKLGK